MKVGLRSRSRGADGFHHAFAQIVLFLLRQTFRTASISRRRRRPLSNKSEGNWKLINLDAERTMSRQEDVLNFSTHWTQPR